MDPLITRDGLKLFTRLWPRANARGTVMILHGLGDHSGRFQHVAAHLNDWGWQATAFDQRGHGQSEGERGVLNASDDLLVDLSLFIDTVKKTQPGPHILLCHSMGGGVGGRFVAEGTRDAPAAWWRPLDALIMSSPAIVPVMTGLQKILAKVLGLLAPTLTIPNGVDPAWVARDTAVVKAYRGDPLVHDRVCARLGNAIADGGQFTLSRAAHWRTPSLLLFAGTDHLVEPAGSEAFTAHAPAALLESQCFPPMYHEIMNDPDKEQVFTRIRNWLDARFPPQA